MTLRRKMAYQIAAMVVGLFAVSAAALWGLRGLHQDYGVSLRGYEELRELYRIGAQLERARMLLSLPTADRVLAAAEVNRAAVHFESQAELFNTRAAEALRTKLSEAEARLREPGTRSSDAA